MQSGNLERFGRLMYESHHSLKNDYEVTGKELDALVEGAKMQEGCIGSRMTGAGFGGCTVSIVKKNKIADFIKNLIRLKGTWIYCPSSFSLRIGFD